MPAEERLNLKDALEASAVPHWITADLLAFMLELPIDPDPSKDQATALLVRLRQLTLTESSPMRGEGASLIPDPIRGALREDLWKTNRQRLLELSNRAHLWFAQGQSVSERIESIYHCFVANPTDAENTWRDLDKILPDLADQRIAADAIEELVVEGVVTGHGKFGRQRTVLAIATEWRSAHGGLSTFNREFCRALAAEGFHVWCYVAAASSEEISEALERDKVRLIVPPLESHASDDARLRNRPPIPPGKHPDFIVSHDRITGPAATSLRENHFPRSTHILFIHTAPSQIEWFKDPGEDATASGKAEPRRQLQIHLATKAHMVAAVGPKLALSIGNELHALTPPRRVFEFLPGLSSAVRPVSPPPGNECLVLGRAEDSELKGLDIAARALALLLPHATMVPKPSLVIRGAPQGTGDDLRNQLLAVSGLGQLHLKVREYTGDADIIQRDMLSSAVVLMPSRTEGFGLVAMEAIALGIPVLISDQSGVGELLGRIVPEHARTCVIPITADMEKDGSVWKDAIQFTLMDKGAAFARASNLRAALLPHLSWNGSVRSLFAATESAAC